MKNSSVSELCSPSHRPGMTNQRKSPPKVMNISESFKGNWVQQTRHKGCGGTWGLSVTTLLMQQNMGQKQLEEGWPCFDPQSEGTVHISGSHGGRCLMWLFTLCPVRKPRDACWWKPAFSFWCSLKPQQAEGYHLTCRVGLLTSINLIRLVPMVTRNPAKLVILHTAVRIYCYSLFQRSKRESSKPGQDSS